MVLLCIDCYMYTCIKGLWKWFCYVFWLMNHYCIKGHEEERPARQSPVSKRPDGMPALNLNSSQDDEHAFRVNPSFQIIATISGIASIAKKWSRLLESKQSSWAILVIEINHGNLFLAKKTKFLLLQRDRVDYLMVSCLSLYRLLEILSQSIHKSMLSDCFIIIKLIHLFQKMFSARKVRLLH